MQKTNLQEYVEVASAPYPGLSYHKFLTMQLQQKQTELDFGMPKLVPTFHNTINETGEQLEASKESAKAEQDVILEFFLHNRDKDFTAHEIWEKVLPSHLLQNVRRAITNLATAERLIKTKIQRKGGYGKMNYTYKLKTDAL